MDKQFVALIVAFAIGVTLIEMAAHAEVPKPVEANAPAAQVAPVEETKKAVQNTAVEQSTTADKRTDGCDLVRGQWKNTKKLREKAKIGYFVHFLRQDLNRCNMKPEDVGETRITLVDYEQQYLYAQIQALAERRKQEAKKQ